MKKILLISFIVASAIITSCARDANVASRNLSYAADSFQIYRRVVFYNGITDKYILLVEGYCSIEVDRYSKQLEVTIKTGPGQYLKHFLGLSDNVTYFAEQLQTANVRTDKYRVVFKPSSIVPTVDVK